MRGYTLPDVAQCGFHMDREKGQSPQWRLVGLGCILAPWLIALAIWLVTK